MLPGGVLLRALSATMLSLLFGASSARAAECVESYTLDGALQDLVAIEEALRSGENAIAAQQARSAVEQLPCLDAVLVAQIAGRTYRAIGAGLYVGGEEEAGRAWMLTSHEVDPTFEYGVQDLPVDHPVARTYAEVRRTMTPDAVPGEYELGEGTHYLDGQRLYTALATPDRPHLYQVEQDELRSWVIEGNDFPEAAAVGAEAIEVKTRRAKDRKQRPEEALPVATGTEVKVIERERPAAKTPLMVAGSAIIAAAGGVYYYSSVTRSRFSESTVQADIERHRQQTNQLVLLSGAVLTAGTGTLAWGIALDGSTPLPTVHLRF